MNSWTYVYIDSRSGPILKTIIKNTEMANMPMYFYQINPFNEISILLIIYFFNKKYVLVNSPSSSSNHKRNLPFPVAALIAYSHISNLSWNY